MAPSPIPHAFLVSQHTWHQRLGHPGSEVLRRLVSHNFISCNKEKPPVIYHACQLGKHVKLLFVSSDTVVTACFDIIHSDVWTSPIPSRSGFKYYVLFMDHYSQHGMDNAYLLLYVHDIVLTAYSQPLLQRIIAFLHQEFSMTDLGSLNYFLGISVTRDSSGMFLSQRKYATEILERAVCLYMHDPREPHFSALKRVLRYVRGTLDYGLQLFFSSTTDLVAYSDADWAGCPSTRRSTSGYYVFIGNNLLSWPSKRQPTLSHSSKEAKYRGVANVVAETCWLRNLLRELHTPLSSTTLVYCDNVSAVYFSSNPVQHQRTKHIEIDIHFVRDLGKRAFLLTFTKYSIITAILKYKRLSNNSLQ
ncbi:ribonuclease H-like domain-containing protein [Tanacetum coccineum]|uniref:Ribonuclease H-like domain-containing protein n=1 Tax=Tanacetum coccineum TaxID=301880 RepID=A0ABQ5DGE8_9ASTR